MRLSVLGLFLAFALFYTLIIGACAAPMKDCSPHLIYIVLTSLLVPDGPGFAISGAGGRIGQLIALCCCHTHSVCKDI